MTLRLSTRTRALYALLIVGVGALFAAPLLLMILTSLKEQSDVFASPLALPDPPSAGGYRRALEVGGIDVRIFNSLVVTVFSVAISTVVGAGAGYACARLRAPRTRAVLLALFGLGLVLPVQSGIVPLFAQMDALGLIGSLLPMILIYTALQLPLTVFIFSGFFQSVPREVEEAALVDGASRLRILRSIVLPLSRPAVVTAVILGVVTVWNEFFVALIFATDPGLQTLPVGLAAFRGENDTDWPAILAYSTVIAIPVIALYVALQRHIVAGVTRGAIR